MKYRKILPLLFVNASLFFSYEANGESFTASQLVEIAIKNSSLATSYDLDAKAKDKLSDQAGAWDNPVIEIGTENKVESGGETRSMRYGLSQTIYMPGKFSTKEKIFKSEAVIARLEATSVELKIKGVVLNLVYEFKASKEKMNHAKERLERFKTVQNFIRSRVFAAPQKKAEASIVTGKLIVLQKELFHIQANTENIWNELNSHLKLSSIPEIQLDWFKKGPSLNRQAMSNLLLANNIELKKQDAKLTQTKNEVDLISLDSWPGLTVSGSYSDGSGINPEKIYGVGLSVPIPIFNANRSARSASELRSKAEVERLNFVKEQTLKELNSAFLNFELAKKSVINLPVVKINELEKAIAETDIGFKRGQVDLLTYLEADSQHFESISAILETQLDLIKSISAIQNLTNNSQLILEN